MSTHKHIDRICCVVLALVLILTVIFINGEALGIQTAASAMGYEARLFDTSEVHTIDLVMDDWDAFLESCADEEYVACTVIIDNEAYKNVAIRAKGNTSLSQVQSYGNDRYSFKIEFDHYDSTKSYYGLDKLCLNNIIQDNTYMKDYLTYQMMGYFGVDAPLCSYAYITVNGEDWGLYLAVESVEEAFLQRNYGNSYGNLYKPDSTDMGGGRGNGGNFDMDEFMENFSDLRGSENGDLPERPGGDMNGGMGGDMGGDMGGGMMGSDDVTLVYTDDDYGSYTNIFDNAKTDITDSDKDRLIASLKKLNDNEDIEEVVNIEEVIRYFVVHNFVVNFDSYTGSMIHNYYLYEEDGLLSMIPWDYNLAFGGFVSESDATSLVNYPIDTPVSGGAVESRPMLAWIFASEEYTELYHQYFAKFISEYFDSGYFERMIDEVQALIAPYVEKDPTKFCTCEAFEEGAAALKEFCLLRAESISGQLDGTIASTSDGQAEDGAGLVDAGTLTISAMGTMNNGGGQGAEPGNSMGGPEGQMPGMMPGEAPGQGGEMPAMARMEPGNPQAMAEQSGTPSETEAGMQWEQSSQQAAQSGAPGGTEAGMQWEQGGPGNMAGNEPMTATETEARILLGVSVGILLLGLAVAYTFKRR